MYKDLLTFIEPKKPLKREEKVFSRRLKEYINRPVHFKVDGDDSPIAYILKDVGKDYVVVVFSEVERSIPISKIIFFQTEAARHYPSML